jgi:hypothetical protein
LGTAREPEIQVHRQTSVDRTLGRTSPQIIATKRRNN